MTTMMTIGYIGPSKTPMIEYRTALVIKSSTVHIAISRAMHRMVLIISFRFGPRVEAERTRYISSCCAPTTR